MAEASQQQGEGKATPPPPLTYPPPTRLSPQAHIPSLSSPGPQDAPLACSLSDAGPITEARAFSEPPLHSACPEGSEAAKGPGPQQPASVPHNAPPVSRCVPGMRRACPPGVGREGRAWRSMMWPLAPTFGGRSTVPQPFGLWLLRWYCGSPARGRTVGAILCPDLLGFRIQYSGAHGGGVRGLWCGRAL